MTHISWFQSYYKSTVIRLWYFCKDRQIVEWNKLRIRKLIPIVNKFSTGMKSIHCLDSLMGKKYAFNKYVSLHPKGFICWNSNPPCDGIWRWSLWEVIRLWGCSPHDGISALKRRDMREFASSPYSPPSMWGHKEKVPMCKSGSSSPKTPDLLAPSTSQSPELWEISVGCLYHTVYGNLLQ